MANKKNQYKPIDTSNIDTDIFIKGMMKDSHKSFVGKENWTHCINCINNSARGDAGTIGNEPANLSCINSKLPIIGFIHLFGDKWIIFSTDNYYSEIGLFDDSQCKYDALIFDQCLNFNQKHLISGASKENFDCTWQIYWDDGLNPSRTINLGPPDRFTENLNVPWKYQQVSGPDTTGTPCVVYEDIEIINDGKKLDCDLIRLAPLMKTPCIELSKGESPGQLSNGTYQAYIAYTINEQQIGDYIGVSNLQPLFDNDNTACSLDVKISNLDTNFDFYKLVILSNNQQQPIAIQVGFYSTHQTEISIDYILENKATTAQVPLNNLPLQNPAYEKSEKMIPVNDYLLRIGPTTQFDFNYQCQANQISTKWVSTEYPAEYYKNGGNKPTFMRDEQYSFFIRFIYATGEKSSSYHIPGRQAMSDNPFFGDEKNQANTDGNNILYSDEVEPWQVTNTAYVDEIDGVTMTDDGGRILSKGQMGYWESSEMYPSEDPHGRWCELCGTNIRHHKFPDEQTDETVDRSSPDNQYIRILGVEFDNITWPVDLEGNIIPNIVSYEILVGSREANKSILSKGIIRNMRQYPLIEGSSGGIGADNPLINNEAIGLYPNYPYNDHFADVYHTGSAPESTQNPGPLGQTNVGYCGYPEGVSIPGEFVASFSCNNVYTFHSPETSFQKPYLNASEVKSYGYTSGFSQGTFKPSEGHPKNVLIRDFVAILAAIIGTGFAISKMRGKRKTTMQFDAQVPNPAVIPPIPGSQTVFELDVQGLETTFTGASFAAPGLGEFAYHSGSAILLDAAAVANAFVLTNNPGTVAGNQSVEFEGTDVKSLPNLLGLISGLFMTFHYAAQGGQEVVDLVYNIARPRQHAWKYNSYGLYSETQPRSNGDVFRQVLTKSRYVGNTFQDFGSDSTGMSLRINNLYRPATVALQTTGTFGNQYNPLPIPFGNGNPLSDSSRQTIGTMGNISSPTRTIRTRIGAHYVALKFQMDNQYGQLDGIKQIPIPCVQNFRLADGVLPPAIPIQPGLFIGDDYIDPTIVLSENYTEGMEFKSGVLFGGDTYINRYNEKVIMPFFWEFLNGQEDGFGFDYRQYQNIGFTRYYMDTNNYNMHALFAPILDFSFNWNVGNGIPSRMRNMDRNNVIGGGGNAWNIAPTFGVGGQMIGYGDDISNSIFVLRKAYMYTHNSGINDFFVESELNVALRHQGNATEQKHYDWTNYTDLNALFHADIIDKGNFYKYDFSLSKYNLVSQMITYSMIQPRDYDPEVADTCYDHYTKRIIYSNQAHKEAKKDFWRVYLPNNYQDFKNVPTTVKPISKSGAMILFPHLSPQLFQGVDTLTTDFNTKLTIGDGGLFNEPMQQISTADLPHEYGSSENAMGVINTPAGIYYMSQQQGKIFSYAQQLENIADAGMKQWFNTYLPSRLLQAFPEMEGGRLADNPMVGIGCQSVYDPNYDIVYFCKKDYEPCDTNDCLEFDAENQQFVYNLTKCDGLPPDIDCPPGTELQCEDAPPGGVPECECCGDCLPGYELNEDGECCVIEYGEIVNDDPDPVDPDPDDSIECVPGCMAPQDIYYYLNSEQDSYDPTVNCHDASLCEAPQASNLTEDGATSCECCYNPDDCLPDLTDSGGDCIPSCLDPLDPWYQLQPYQGMTATCHNPAACKFWGYVEPVPISVQMNPELTGLNYDELATYLGLTMCSDIKGCFPDIFDSIETTGGPIRKIQTDYTPLTLNHDKSIFLEISKSFFKLVNDRRRKNITLYLPFVGNKSIPVRLTHFKATDPGYKALRRSKDGTIEDRNVKLHTYKVNGKQKNGRGGIDTYTGVISVFPQNKLVGLIYKNGKPYEIKNIRNNEYTLFDVNDTIKKTPFICGTENLLNNDQLYDRAVLKQKLQKASQLANDPTAPEKLDALEACLKMAVDVDYYTFSSSTFNSNYDDVAAWVEALIANVNFIYEYNLNVSIVLVQLQVFEDQASDPYDQLQFQDGDPLITPDELAQQYSCEGLNMIYDHWNDPAFPELQALERSVVNLWTFKLETRGQAWGIGGLCIHESNNSLTCVGEGPSSTPAAYAICGVGASTNNVGPTEAEWEANPEQPWISVSQSWALKVVSHELGHNIGAYHTSTCVYAPDILLEYEGDGNLSDATDPYSGGDGVLENCADEENAWVSTNPCVINNPQYNPGNPFFPVQSWVGVEGDLMGGDIGQPIDYYTIMSQGVCQTGSGGETLLMFNPIVKKQYLVPALEDALSIGCLDCEGNTVDPLAFGCTDPLAENYDPNAEYNNGSCVYPYCDCEYGFEMYVAGTDILATTQQCLDSETEVECRRYVCDTPPCEDAIYTDITTPIELGDPDYFTDISWTASFDPKIKGWISFHDWHPELSMSSHNHFLTTKTIPHTQPLCPPGYTYNETLEACEYEADETLESIVDVDWYPCCPNALSPIDIYVSIDTSGSTGPPHSPTSVYDTQLEFLNGIISGLAPFMNLGLVQLGCGTWSGTGSLQNCTHDFYPPDGSPAQTVWFNNTTQLYTPPEVNYYGGSTNIGNGIQLLNIARDNPDMSSLGDRTAQPGFRYFAILITDGVNFPACNNTNGCGVIMNNNDFASMIDPLPNFNGTGATAGADGSPGNPTILWGIRSNPWGDCFPDQGDDLGGTPTNPNGGWFVPIYGGNVYNWPQAGFWGWTGICNGTINAQERMLDTACELSSNFGNDDFRVFGFGPDASMGECTIETGFVDQIIARMIPPCECECAEGYTQIGSTYPLLVDDEGNFVTGEDGNYQFDPLYPPHCVKIECECPPAEDVDMINYPDSANATFTGTTGECPDAALWGYGNIYGLDANGDPYTYPGPEELLECQYNIYSEEPSITSGGGIWKHNVRCDLFNNYYDVQYPWEIELIESIGQTVNTVRSIEYQLESYEYKPKYDANGCMINYGCDDRWHDLMYNFDEAIVYNSEQVSGLLNLIEQTADINDTLSYPIIGVNDIQILYKKVEQKYRFDQFWDITADRNISEPIFITRLNGYIKDLNAAYMNYNKTDLERKKFRHYTNNLILRKKVEYAGGNGLIVPIPECDCEEGEWITIQDMVVPCVCGCTDFNALNYNSSATNDDGSCVYPLDGDPVEPSNSQQAILHTRKMILKLVNTKINLSIR
jgi:hypothetical protein